MPNQKIIINENLKELHSSGYEVRDGEPDIRGWKVESANGENIGKVKELLFDTASLRVRYVIVSLNGKPLNLLSRDLIIPVGLAELNLDNKYVLFPQVTIAHYATLPEYKKGEVAIATERNIRSVFAPTKAIVYKDPDFNDPDFYNNEYFDEKRMYKPHQPIVNHTELVNENIPVIKEEKKTDIITNSRKTENLTDDTTYYRKVGPNHFEPVDNTLVEKKFDDPFLNKREARRSNDITVDEEIRERRKIINDAERRNVVDLNNLNVKDLPED